MPIVTRLTSGTASIRMGIACSSNKPAKPDRSRSSRVLLQILQIDTAAQGPLVDREVVKGDEMGGYTEDRGCDLPAPRIGKLDAGDLRQDINAHRSNSNLVDHLLPGECLCCNSIVAQGSAELAERCNHARGILRRIVDPHVEVLRIAGFAVLHDSEAADDQIFNFE